MLYIGPESRVTDAAAQSTACGSASRTANKCPACGSSSSQNPAKQSVGVEAAHLLLPRNDGLIRSRSRHAQRGEQQLQRRVDGLVVLLGLLLHGQAAEP